MDQDPSDFARRQAGLTESEATLLLAQVGPNVIRTEQIRTVFHIIAETLREPTFVLLLVAGGLYLVLGSLGEGLFVCASAVVSLGMVILQETRSERVLQALQALAEPDARVIRDGRQRRIPSRELVPDDIMLITAGERIAVDGRITSAGVWKAYMSDLQMLLVWLKFLIEIKERSYAGRMLFGLCNLKENRHGGTCHQVTHQYRSGTGYSAGQDYRLATLRNAAEPD